MPKVENLANLILKSYSMLLFYSDVLLVLIAFFLSYSILAGCLFPTGITCTIIYNIISIIRLV